MPSGSDEDLHPSSQKPHRRTRAHLAASTLWPLSSDAGPPVFSHPEVPPPFMARPASCRYTSPPSFDPSFVVCAPACGPPVPSFPRIACGQVAKPCQAFLLCVQRMGRRGLGCPSAPLNGNRKGTASPSTRLNRAYHSQPVRRHVIRIPTYIFSCSSPLVIGCFGFYNRVEPRIWDFLSSTPGFLPVFPCRPACASAGSLISQTGTRNGLLFSRTERRMHHDRSRFRNPMAFSVVLTWRNAASLPIRWMTSWSRALFRRIYGLFVTVGETYGIGTMIAYRAIYSKGVSYSLWFLGAYPARLRGRLFHEPGDLVHGR